MGKKAAAKKTTPATGGKQKGKQSKAQQPTKELNESDAEAEADAAKVEKKQAAAARRSEQDKEWAATKKWKWAKKVNEHI